MPKPLAEMASRIEAWRCTLAASPPAGPQGATDPRARALQGLGSASPDRLQILSLRVSEGPTTWYVNTLSPATAAADRLKLHRNLHRLAGPVS